MDPELHELREEVKRLRVLTEDTNKTVHKMHRAARWSFVFSVLWWLTIIGLTGAVYYYYLQPYVEQIIALYNQAKGLDDELFNFFSGWRGTAE